MRSRGLKYTGPSLGGGVADDTARAKIDMESNEKRRPVNENMLADGKVQRSKVQRSVIFGKSKSIVLPGNCTRVLLYTLYITAMMDAFTIWQRNTHLQQM